MKQTITPDYRLDMVGEPCPYPAVATLEAMPQLAPGEVLEVITDYERTTRDTNTTRETPP